MSRKPSTEFYMSVPSPFIRAELPDRDDEFIAAVITYLNDGQLPRVRKFNYFQQQYRRLTPELFREIQRNAFRIRNKYERRKHNYFFLQASKPFRSSMP